jgi:hypothetical protein
MRRGGGYIAIEGPMRCPQHQPRAGVGPKNRRAHRAQGYRQLSVHRALLAGSGKVRLPVQLQFLPTCYNHQRQLAQQDPLVQATVTDYLLAKERADLDYYCWGLIKKSLRNHMYEMTAIC